MGICVFSVGSMYVVSVAWCAVCSVTVHGVNVRVFIYQKYRSIIESERVSRLT